MSVRKRRWRDKQGRAREKWMVHIEHTWPDGRKQSIRKVSPVQTKRGAEQYERELRRQLASGEWEEESKKKKIPTFNEFAEEFLAFQATINKPKVLETKRSMLRVHVLPAFGDLRLDRLDERAIDAYKVAKLETGLAPATVNKQLKLVSRMLRVARKWKIIRTLPDIELAKKRKPVWDFLDFDEADRFLAAAAEREPAWHPYMVVAIRTGLRAGELGALRWREDIDLERGRLCVQRAFSRGHGISSTKNDKIRELPLTWDAVRALRVQRARSNGELVFTRRGKPINYNQTNQVMERIARHAGMRRISNHVLRHTFASHAVMRGVPLRQVQEWLGHGDVTVTMRYAHLAEGYGDELIQRLAPPPPEDGEDGARSQHKDNSQNEPPVKSPPDRR